MTKRTAGGAATIGGTAFQVGVASWFAVKILAENHATPPFALPVDTTLRDILLETAQPTDDLKVSTFQGGQILVQVKTSLTLSPADSSPLASVIDQFVRQYQAGYTAPGSPQRPLDPSLDRLVLATSHAAPATIRDVLRGVLDTIRSTGHPTTLAEVVDVMSAGEKAAFDTVVRHVRRAWQATGAMPSESDVLSLLNLVYVISLDLRTDGPDRVVTTDLLRQVVLLDPTQADDAWITINHICMSFGLDRTGGDGAYFRGSLANVGIRTKVPPSYREPISRLQDYTRRRLTHLERLADIRRFGTRIKIDRPVAAEVGTMVEAGHLVVTGAPGAGKSGCLYELARRKLEARNDVVLLAVDLLKADTESALTRELGLPEAGGLAAVLENWPGDGPGYLVVDALDAARSELSVRVVCTALAEVQARAPRWHIVASVREFDLQYSRDLREIFEGAPHPQRRNDRFRRIRHIVVEKLDDSELTQVYAHAPDVEKLIQSGSIELGELVRNPFNLRLLCELLADETDSRRLTSVRTQIGLLELYWSRRVTDEDPTSLRSALLDKAIQLMVESRSLITSRVKVVQAFPAGGEALAHLLSQGVLTPADKTVAVADDDVSFSHNVLYDYAVSRLWLRNLDSDIIEKLTRAENQELLLSIRPSIVLSFQRLWHEDGERQRFWKRGLAFLSAPDMRPIGKILPGVVAAGEYRSYDDIAWLVEQIGRTNEERVAELISYTVNAAVTQNADAPSEHPLSGDGAPEWIRMARELSIAALQKTAWSIQSLVTHIIDKKTALTAEQLVHAGEAARRMLAHSLVTDRRFARTAIDVVCRTAESAPEESVRALGPCLTPEEVASHGHEQLWSMAQNLSTLVRVSPDFALRLVDAVFATSVSRDERVSMGAGRIFGVSMSKSDLFGTAAHAIVDNIRRVLFFDPVTATRMVLLIVQATVRREHSFVENAAVVHEVPFLGATAKIRLDGSYVWAAGNYLDHEDWWNSLNALAEHLQAVAAMPGHESRLREILTVIRDANELAIVWKIVLDAAYQAPATLGVAVVELLFSTAVLGSMETRTSAGNLIAVIYPHLTVEQRARVEAAILRISDETPRELEEHAQNRRDRMLGCIPSGLLATEAARSARHGIDAKGGPPPNTPDFWISSAEVLDEDESLRWHQVPVDLPQNRIIRDLTKEIRDFKPVEEQTGLSSEQIESIMPKVRELAEMARSAKQSNVHPQLAQDAHQYVIACCARLAQSVSLLAGVEAWSYVRDTLLAASNDPVPCYDPQQDVDWDSQSPSWGSPQPRIDAARGLIALVSKSLTDRHIVNVVQRLASDPVPAVRFQILTRMSVLWEVDRNLFWHLFWNVTRQEQRLGILDFFVKGLLLHMPGSERTAARKSVRLIYRRTRQRDHSNHLRRAYGLYVLRDVLWNDDATSWRYLRLFINFPLVFSPELSEIVRRCGELIVMENGKLTEEKNTRARTFGFGLLRWATCALRHEIVALHRSHGDRYESWPEAAVEQLRCAYQMLESVVRQVHFASGASEQRGRGAQVRTSDEDRAMADKRKRFAEEAGHLLDDLCQIEHVRIAHNLLQTLNFLSSNDPVTMFMRVHRSVTTSRRDGIQYEPIAADLVVEIIEQYLADHRSLLKTDRRVREAMLDILDLFVGPGWPRATRLTYRLEEVFR
ncbi:hypothetical protein [Sorangium sp. So ce1389]|uniref:hypothetical protein n=1 Tax=Sorangium sp. So ce1389 TaxID=3133336 RepID=UPI003F62BE76